MTAQKTPGVGALALFAFLLFAMPRMNVRVGPVPLYMIDVVAAYILYGALRRGHSGLNAVRYPYRGIMAIITVLIVASEVMSVVYGADILNSVYLAMRWLLACGMVFAAPGLIRTPKDIELILKGVTIGIFITSLLMILTSLPMTRNLVVNTVFRISFLEPAAGAAQRYSNLDEATGGRGRSLVGVSILSSTFVAIAWPLVAFLRTGVFRLSARWNILSMLVVFLAPFAVVMSYSRQAAGAGFLVVLGVILLPTGKLRRIILRPVALSVALVAVVGASSSIFYFDRFVTRFSALAEAPLEDAREFDRVYSYVEPFSHAMEHPMFLLLGEGTAIHRTPYSEQEGAANHSLMGAGYFSHGMISTLLFFFLLLGFFSFANWHRKSASLHGVRDWPRAVFLAFLPILAMAAFAPGLGNHPRVMYSFSFVVALVSALRNRPFVQTQPVKEPETSARRPFIPQAGGPNLSKNA